MNRHITLNTPSGTLHGYLDCPEQARGLALLARIQRTPRDEIVAAGLTASGYATLSMGLLTTRELNFADAAQNIPRLCQRLLAILGLLANDGDTEELPLALFAAGDATPAAIRIAARRDQQARVLVCHGGLIDRAGLQALKFMTAPLLMLFDADDSFGPAAFHRAQTRLRATCDEQTLLAGEDTTPYITAWFDRHLPAATCS
ncbi:MAG: hypothetical protein FWF20_04415 [Betaproteobacteria bacterium]|nr:hypothetical protein [Betaproteobacteria bacterium]MCL2886022.1 hypothetical protein [Betaproteobacteria bacterium]